MLFSELYSAYYNAVASILKYAVSGELSEKMIKDIAAEKAFGESILTIPSALREGSWQLLTDDLNTPLQSPPAMPLTTLEKRWLKSLSLDPRVGLFDFDFTGLENVKPLFTPNDVYFYDQYADGDDFSDKGYRQRFKIILHAIKTRQSLKMELEGKGGKPLFVRVMPEKLEYSEKDNKIRLYTSGCRYRRIVRLSSILWCSSCGDERLDGSAVPKLLQKKVCLRLFDGRNTLERAMLHFAHFKKTVEKTGTNQYAVEITYEAEDETEVLIRILSFGPFVQVTAPDDFVELLRERLKKQQKCGLK